MDFTEDGNPYCKELRLGLVDGEPVVHVAVCPFFQSGCYRATRLVVMSEWHLDGNGRRRLPVIFHTSHPQLAAALMRLPLWVQKSAVLYRKSGTKFHQRR